MGKPTPVQAVDLFGMESATKRTNDRPEAAALCEVLKALNAHPAVAWCERQNSGAAKVGNRFVRFGWPGCADILGQLRDGRFLAVEVKAATGRPSPEQTLFLARINQAGGWVSLPATAWTFAANWQALPITTLIEQYGNKETSTTARLEARRIRKPPGPTCWRG